MYFICLKGFFFIQIWIQDLVDYLHSFKLSFCIHNTGLIEQKTVM